MKKIFSILGPGLIYAGAAIGISHLVQATKAGALFNYQLIIAVIIIHLIKYQFFKFGPLYTSITGKNILTGYKKIGSWAIYLYIILTLISMCIIQATVTYVTASLLKNIIPIDCISIKIWTLILLIICSLILIIGRYVFLEKISKIIVISLSIMTIIALGLLLINNEKVIETKTIFDFSNKTHIIFLITFLGWMPAPMEVSVWHSIWAENKTIKNIKETLLDFKISFIGTAILAIIFIILGAETLYGTNINFPKQAKDFTHLLINIYKNSLGSFSGFIINIIAFFTMFSTSLTCLDASSRSLNKAQNLCKKKNFKNLYTLLIIFNILGTSLIIFFWLKNMGNMIKLATTLAFLSTPILATMNYLAITNKNIPKKYQQNKIQKIISIFCILLLIIFNILYFIFC